MANDTATVTQTVNTVTVDSTSQNSLELSSTSGSSISLTESPSSSTTVSITPSSSSLKIDSVFAPKISPVFTGTPIAPTASPGTNSTQIATTAYVDSAVTLENTLGEMNDVNVTSLSDNEILQYDTASSKWINQTLAEADIASAATLSSHTGSTSNPHNVTAAQVNLGNVTNESKATMFTSPVFTGNPTAPTQPLGNDSVSIATTAFVDNAINALIAAAPDTLDTLNEIAEALNNDADFHQTITDLANTKLPLAGGTMTGNLLFGNDVQLRLGGANDIRLFSESSTNRIDFYNHDTEIRTLTNDIDLIFKTTTGGTTAELLRLDASASSIRIPDTVYLQVGSSSDLGIAFDGTNSIISNVTNDLNIQNYSSTGDINIQATNGSGGVVTYLTLDGSQQQMKANKNLVFFDNKRLRLGTSADADLYSTNANIFYDHNNYDALFRHLTADKDFVFSTTPSGGSLTEILRIDASASSIVGSGLVSLTGGGSSSPVGVNGLHLMYDSSGGTAHINAQHNGTSNRHLSFKAASYSFNNGGVTLANNLTLSYAYPRINLTDTNNDSDYSIINNDGSFSIYDVTNASHRLLIAADGNTTFAGNLKLNDNKLLQLGSDADLQIKHDGSGSYINQTGTGDLHIRQTIADQSIFLSADNGSGNATPYIQLNGSVERITFSKPARILDNVQLQLGSDADLKIYHNGANNGFIQNTTAYLVLESDNIILRKNGGSEDYAKFFGDGAVDLYFNNIVKLSTSASGATVSGNITLKDGTN